MYRITLLLVGSLALGSLAACGDDDGQACLPNDHTACMQDVVYWLDSCGVQGEIADTCDCGCSADFTGCESCTCQPDCGTKVCGDDGCGGSCGDCDPLTETCSAQGQCEACVPDCGTRVCGDNGCNGSCGDCELTETCNAQGQCEGGTTSNVLAVDCTVPFVLDAAQVSDMTYMASHFADLVQAYCITGLVDDIDVTTYAEKMYYGQHDAGTTLSLVQTSMTAAMAAEYTVKVDFTPDSDVTTGALWPVSVGGLNDPEAVAGLIRYLSQSSVCLWAIGLGGQLTFGSAENVTQVEGGAFTITGSIQMGNPWDLSDFCTQAPAGLPCCTR